MTQCNLCSTEIIVKESCAVITLTLIHTWKLPAAGMGHNWVLTRESDFRGVVSDGIDARQIILLGEIQES